MQGVGLTVKSFIVYSLPPGIRCLIRVRHACAKPEGEVSLIRGEIVALFNVLL